MDEPSAPAPPAGASPASLTFASPSPDAEAQTKRRLRAFAVKLLRAFHKADVYSIERLGLRPHNRRTLANSGSFYSLTLSASGGAGSPTSARERNRTLLRRVRSTCISESIDALCKLLGASDDAEDPVAEALEPPAGAVPPVVTLEDIVEVLRTAESNFMLVSSSLSRSQSNQKWVTDYNPDWKTRNLVWNLVQSLGRIIPPDGSARPFGRLKEACFATLFNGDYLMQQRKKARFSETLLRRIPQPGRWDADTGWVAVAFFCSIPLASTVYSFDNAHRLPAFWGIFAVIFSIASLCTVVFYAKYTSWYATRLLDSAAASIPRTARLSFGYDEIAVDGYEAATNSVGGGSNEGNIADCVTHDGEVRITMDELGDDEDDKNSNTQSLLRLYQVSMLVERLHSSYYFGEAMLLGLSESQVYTAIEVILSSDSMLGKQFAAFSFTAIAISSRGVSLGSRDSSSLDPGVRFSFGLFGMLSAAGFLCGLTSAILSDLMHRQLCLTQTKEESTSHGFASHFASFLRLNGGLNGFAGMFLATAIFHFLVSIFQVSPWAALPLGAVWLIGGSIAIESFLASYAYWQLTEVFSDLGETVDPPIQLSPSPVTGSIQIVIRRVRKLLGRKEEKGD